MHGGGVHLRTPMDGGEGWCGVRSQSYIHGDRIVGPLSLPAVRYATGTTLGEIPGETLRLPCPVNRSISEPPSLIGDETTPKVFPCEREGAQYAT